MVSLLFRGLIKKLFTKSGAVVVCAVVVLVYCTYLKWDAGRAKDKADRLTGELRQTKLSLDLMVQDYKATRESLLESYLAKDEVTRVTQRIKEESNGLEDNNPSPALRSHIDGLRRDYEDRTH